MRRGWIALALLAAVLLLHRSEAQTPSGSAEPPAITATASEPTTGVDDEHGRAAEGAAGPAKVADSADGAAGETAHETHDSGHSNPVTPVLLALVLILTGAKVFGEIFERIHQPAVLGELIFGVLLGNLALAGFHGLDFLTTNQGIAILSEMGVILLLFEVGLESNVSEMLSVGPSSLVVAILGVIVPFFLGWGLSAILLPHLETLIHVFIGATLCATSVGITARVLADLGKLDSRETKVILGAAVIDDVLGLVILAVVQGAIIAAGSGQAIDGGQVVSIILKALGFLIGAIVFGSLLSPLMFRLACALRIKGLLLTLSLAFCFLLAYLANLIDLAPIVGAFAAGLILDKVHYEDLQKKHEEHPLEDLLHPINQFLVPIFFVLMGTKVDLATFTEKGVLGFALLLSLVAVAGKMVCAFGVLEKGLDSWSIAVGMVPRGEVGLIFANVGAGLMLHGHPVIDRSELSAVVIMVIITTLLTPPVLKVTLAMGDRRKAQREAASET